MAYCRKTFRKVITSPDVMGIVNPKNKQLAERYLKNFATRRSPVSVKVYRSNLNIFFAWNVLNNDNVFYIDIKKLDFMDFFDFCVNELKWASNRYAQMHSCLSSFSTWIENYYDEQYPQFKNLLPKIEKLPKESVRKKSVFSKEEIDNLMNRLEQDNKVQDQCLLALVTSCGARISELARFTLPIINEDNLAFDDLFLETTDKIRIKGRGINGKSEIRYILKDTFLPYFHKWLPIRYEMLKKYKKQHDSLFINQNGDPANSSNLRGIISSWNDIMDQPMYAHALRHYFVTNLIQVGLDKDFVQSLLSWASSDMVDVYCDLTAKDRKWKNLDKLKAVIQGVENNSVEDSKCGNTDIDELSNSQ